jgi:probable phosphoglycerate mutase
MAEYRVISSDLRRAVQTAEVICEELGGKLEFSESLREFNNGIAANRYREEVQEYFTEATEPYLDWQPWPEGETWRTFYNRVSRFMDSLDLEKPLIIVCHAGTIQMIVVWWLMTPPEYFGRIAFHTHTSSITVLGETEFKDRLIERLNDTIHLSLNGMGYNLPRPGKERED